VSVLYCQVSGLRQFTLIVLYEKQVLGTAAQIVNDNTHILRDEYILLPAFKKFGTITFKTNVKR